MSLFSFKVHYMSMFLSILLMFIILLVLKLNIIILITDDFFLVDGGSLSFNASLSSKKSSFVFSVLHFILKFLFFFALIYMVVSLGVVSFFKCLKLFGNIQVF